MSKKTRPKPRLTRQDWIDAAIELLTQAGIGAVSVEQLGTRLGVTRGSIYDHFSDREDLLRAMLDYWAQRWTYEVRDQIAALGLDASTTLFALMKAIRSNRAADYDAPFRAWALHDPLAQAVVERVDQVRLDQIQRFIRIPLGEQIETAAGEQAGDDEQQYGTPQYSRYSVQHMLQVPQRCRVVRQISSSSTYKGVLPITLKYGFSPSLDPSFRVEVRYPLKDLMAPRGIDCDILDPCPPDPALS